MKPVGIDLGTTNSVVAVFERGRVRTLSVYGQQAIPSVVCWNPNTGERLIGEEAKKRVLIDPEMAIVSNKRFMGDKGKQYKVLGKTYSPVDIASFILKYLVDGASEALGEKVTKAVITVPAYFNQNQKEDTKLAAEMIGLEVLQLQAEPTAAAILYGYEKEKNQTILVYDLGGGTFDVSILSLAGNTFKVIGIGGDAELGGDNFDEAIVDYICKAIQLELGVDVKSDGSREARALRQKIKEVAEVAKKELSSVLRTEIFLPSVLGKGSFEQTLTRKEFEEIIYPYLDKSLVVLNQVLQDTNLTKDEINRVICVGGSTKIPAISQMLAARAKQPHMAPDVDQSVAQGAALTAASLLKPIESSIDILPGLEATNVTPLHLGIRLEDDMMGVVIPKFTELPCTVEREFTTSFDNATETDIVVYQGNERLCVNNVCLGGFLLKGILKAKAGDPRIVVKFSLDRNDLLKIEARDQSSLASGNLEIARFTPQPYVATQKTHKRVEDLAIGVSKVGFDDVGAILREMKLPWTKIKSRDFRQYDEIKKYDVIFINCLAGGNASQNATALQTFVRNGGVLYASDCAYSHIDKAFPGSIDFKRNSKFRSKISSQIKDQTFIELIGKDKMAISFNSVLYYADQVNAAEGKVFVTGDYGSTRKPIVVGFPFEKGYVLFTAFHNYGGCSREEKELLKYVLLQAVSEVTKTPLREIAGLVK